MKKRKKTSLKKSDLAFTINLLSTSIKCGHDIFSSINSLKESIAEPLASEFKQMIQEQKIGLASDEILINFANRLKVPAIHQMVQALLTSIITGASPTDLLDQISKDIRNNEVDFKTDKTLFHLKSFAQSSSNESTTPATTTRSIESEVFKLDEKFLSTHGSMQFLKESLHIGKNILVVIHNHESLDLLQKHFKEFMWVDLEKENIAQALLSLSDSPSEKGKILTIKASNLRLGFQRIKAKLAYQEKMANTLSIKLILDLFYLVPLQLCVSSTKSQQSWISEISELRTILEDGTLFIEPIFLSVMTGLNKDLNYLGYFKATGYIPSILDEIEKNGGQVGREIFFLT